MPDEKKPAIIHLNHAPMTLRIDEIVRGEGGIEQAKLVAEIPLERGRNEVDAEAWAKWLENNKDGVLVQTGLVFEEQQKEEHDDGEEAGDPADRGAGGAHPEQGEVRDGGVEDADEHPAPVVQG